MKKNNICFVDFDASHISLTVCELNENTLQKIVFFSKTEISASKTKHNLFDTTELYAEMLKLIDEAEKQTKITIFEIILIVSSTNIKTTLLSKTFAFAKAQKLSKTTIENMLIKSTKSFTAIKPLEQILDIINTNYTLDKTSVVDNPYKLSCNFAEIKTNILSINSVFEKKFSSYLERFKLHVKHYIHPCIAVSSFLKPFLGGNDTILLINFGGNTTDYCIFNQQNIILCDSLDFGENDTTQNIAKALNTFPSYAEKLKREISVENSNETTNEFTKYKTSLMQEKIKHIMDSDIEKIAMEIKNSIKSNTKLEGLMTTKIILFGNASKYQLTAEIFQNVFNHQVDTLNETIFSLDEKSSFFEKFSKENLTTDNIAIISGIDFYLSNLTTYENAKRGFLFKMPSKITCLLRDLLY